MSTQKETPDTAPDNTATETPETPAKASWPVTGKDVAQNTADLPEAARELLRWFHGWAIGHALSMREAAQKIEVNPSTVFRVFKGQYASPADGSRITPAKMLTAIRALRKDEERRSGMSRVDFVATPTAKKVWWACDLARASRRIVMLVGRSQTGKTSAALAYQRKEGEGTVRYVRVSASGTGAELWRDLAFACAVSADGASTKVKARVLGAIDQHTFLLVDEIHLFTYAYRRKPKYDCLEILREVHDKTGCGMVLIGTNVFRHAVESGEGREKLEQLAWRGVYPVQLPDDPTPEDLAAIYASYGLSEPKGDTKKLMGDIARERHLTYVTEILRLGARISSQHKTPMTWEHVMDAHGTFYAASLK
jgi:DNA transposition AAA+ family ATPase